MQRATIASSTARLEGIGIHSGKDSWVQIHPAGESDLGRGLLFRPTGAQNVPLSSCDIVSTVRCTTVSVGNTTLDTVEHLLSALWGLGITDAVIEFYGGEVPILDGSAKEFFAALKEAGIVQTQQQIPEFQPAKSIRVSDESGSILIATPAERFSISVMIDYPNRPAIGAQAAFYDANYADSIAPARTYGFLSELDPLQARGLALGARIDNCIALDDTGAADPRTPLRFENELARHKLLDVIGDLARVGLDIKAHIFALRPSHAVNCKLAKRILDDFYAG